MIRRICDCCGDEITDEIALDQGGCRWTRSGMPRPPSTLHVEVNVCVKGEVCWPCIETILEEWMRQEQPPAP